MKRNIYFYGIFIALGVLTAACSNSPDSSQSGPASGRIIAAANCSGTFTLCANSNSSFYSPDPAVGKTISSSTISACGSSAFNTDPGIYFFQFSGQRSYNFNVPADQTIYITYIDNPKQWIISNAPFNFSGFYPSQANSIYVYNGTIYTAGRDSSNNACYWIGTAKTQLADGGTANSIFVTNGTVYTAGLDANSNACYWTGTAKTQLTSGGKANSIFVYNDTVYTAGQDNTIYYSACFWTGTTETMLPGATLLEAYSIFVTNGTVYTAGIGWDTQFEACYWTGTK